MIATAYTAEDLGIVDLARQVLARVDFPTFLTYCKTQTNDGTASMEPWYHFFADEFSGAGDPISLFDALESRVNIISVLKARQEGVSWFMAAYMLWTAQFADSDLPILIFSRVLDDAEKLLEKSMFIYDRLPPGLQVPLKVGWNRTKADVYFASGGRLLAFPATKHAGRGYTARMVVMDEAAIHPEAEDNFVALKPQTQQMVLVSTAQGGTEPPEDPDELEALEERGRGNFFGRQWLHDWLGKSHGVGFFFPWWVRPTRPSHGKGGGLTPIHLPYPAPDGGHHPECLDGEAGPGPGFCGDRGFCINGTWWDEERLAYVEESKFLAEFPRNTTDAFARREGLVYDNYDERKVRVARHPWRYVDSHIRIAGVDWGSGGGDPTAIVILGYNRATGQVHQFDELVVHGDITIREIAQYLWKWHKQAPLASVECDPIQGTSVVELTRLLRRRGLAARKGANSRHHILLMKTLLKEERFTMHRGNCADSHHQFLTYYWDPKKNKMTGESYHTLTSDSSHHADTHDARRYALVKLIGYSEKANTKVIRRVKLRGRRRKARAAA